MRRRTILLIDGNQSTRRQRAIMRVTHGFVVRAAENIQDVELPFTHPAPDLVLRTPRNPSVLGTEKMRLLSFRMKDGNCVIIFAKDEKSAVKILNEMGVQSTVAGVRQISRFVANFALTDAGDLRTTLLDPRTLDEFMPDYPLLQVARAQ